MGKVIILKKARDTRALGDLSNFEREERKHIRIEGVLFLWHKGLLGADELVERLNEAVIDPLDHP